MDADSCALKPLDDRLLHYPVWVYYENERATPGLIANGIIGAEPGGTLLTELIKKIGHISVEQAQKINISSTWIQTGPHFFTNTHKNMENSELVVLPSYHFLPTHHTGLKYKGDGIVYAHQLWGSTPNLTLIIKWHLYI